MRSLSKLKIISGGQTGVDRAALDVALELGFNSGGFCPKGRLAEDGIIPIIYPLTETKTQKHSERTELNIKIADATLVLFNTNIDEGTRKTIEFCKRQEKPFKIVTLYKKATTNEILKWIKEHNIMKLNIAGPRESNAVGIYSMAFDFLFKLFSIIDFTKNE